MLHVKTVPAITSHVFHVVLLLWKLLYELITVGYLITLQFIIKVKIIDVNVGLVVLLCLHTLDVMTCSLCSMFHLVGK